MGAAGDGGQLVGGVVGVGDRGGGLAGGGGGQRGAVGVGVEPVGPPLGLDPLRVLVHHQYQPAQPVVGVFPYSRWHHIAGDSTPDVVVPVEDSHHSGGTRIGDGVHIAGPGPGGVHRGDPVGEGDGVIGAVGPIGDGGGSRRVACLGDPPQRVVAVGGGSHRGGL